MLLKLMPRSNYIKPQKNDRTDAVISKSAYHDSVYLLFLLFQFIFAICFFQLFTMQPVFYKTQWHFNERFIGGLMAFSGVMITLVEMVLINNLEGKRHPLQYTAVGVIVVGIGFMLLNILPSAAFAAVLVMAVITLGEMMSMPFMSSFWIVRTTDSNRGEYAGLYTMTWSSAQIGAPLLGSLVIAYINYKTLWWLMGGLCTVAAIGFLNLYFYLKRKPMEKALLESAGTTS
jgi:predicted MFS family arabinose efflux permease